MIRFAVLGSGSKGNAIYVEVDGVRFLVDCGFTKKELGKRLTSIGREIKDIEIVFVTHRHEDHLAPWVEKELNASLSGHCDCGKVMTVESFSLSHDESCFGYTIQDNDGNKIAIISDTGCVSEEALGHLFDCQAILIETSYDIDMLVDGKYPTELQERVASDLGHLMNEDAAAVVKMVAGSELKFIVALHLSAANNNPELVKFCLNSVGTGAEVVVSSQKEATKMMVIM